MAAGGWACPGAGLAHHVMLTASSARRRPSEQTRPGFAPNSLRAFILFFIIYSFSIIHFAQFLQNQIFATPILVILNKKYIFCFPAAVVIQSAMVLFNTFYKHIGIVLYSLYLHLYNISSENLHICNIALKVGKNSAPLIDPTGRPVVSRLHPAHQAAHLYKPW